jgi:hypothetical protein
MKMKIKIFVLFLCIVFVSCHNSKKSEHIKRPIKRPLTIKYKIVHDWFIVYDTPIYYVLIDKINLSNDKFKDDIKNIINDIASQKGKQINIDFFDDKNILEHMYEGRFDMNITNAMLTEEERKELRKHNIASFYGELKMGILYFYKSATPHSPTRIEYNPKIYN